MEIIPKTNKTWRAFCPSMVENRTRILLLLQRNVPGKYTKDREGVDRLLQLSIRKYVRKENICVERPPTQKMNKTWIIHLSMFEMEVQSIEKILQTKPNVLNLMCTKIEFRRNRARQDNLDNERSFDERNGSSTVVTEKDSTTIELENPAPNQKLIDSASSTPGHHEQRDSLTNSSAKKA